jgi:hypothetical protein
MSEPLYEDPVVAEIHAIRAQMLAECGGDHHKLMEQVCERQWASGRRVIPAPPATPSTTQSTAAVGSSVAGGGTSPTARRRPPFPQLEE